MLSPSLLGSLALVVYVLCGAALSSRLPVNFRNEIDKRLVCVEDDTELSFQEYQEDTVSFCSAFLGIPLLTSTLSITAKTFACPCPIYVAIC